MIYHFLLAVFMLGHPVGPPARDTGIYYFKTANECAAAAQAILSSYEGLGAICVDIETGEAKPFRTHYY